jgi:uncharacterized protein (TIGR02246 family)
LAACSHSADPSARAAQSLRDGEVASFVKDWSDKDAERIASHFAEDGNLMVPDGPVLTGANAIREFLKDTVADPNWSLSLQPRQIEVSGDLGYARGSYALTTTDAARKAAVTETGRFVTIFRKGSTGAWKAIQHISNAEVPFASR